MPSFWKNIALAILFMHTTNASFEIEDYQLSRLSDIADDGLSKIDRNKRELLSDMFENDHILDIDEKSLISQKSRLRSRREIIEEEGVKNVNRKASNVDITQPPEVKQWIPQPSLPDDELNSLPNPESDLKAPAPQVNTQPLLDRQNGREARGATKDEWVKLPYLARPLENEQLSTSLSNIDDVNHRMPRVNFVTQNKGLQTAESRNQRESIPRGIYRSSDLRTDFYPSNRDARARNLDYSSYSRQSYYYPDDYRRRSAYDDLGYYDDYYYDQRRSPSYDRYDIGRSNRGSGRRDYNDYNRYRPYDRYDANDGYYDRYDKPRRIIYYANLPDVVRSPPNVYRYSSTPYSRYDDDRYTKDYRQDSYRGNAYPRYPYSPLKKSENEGPRDLSASGTTTKEKAAEALKRQQEQQKKANEDSNRGRDGNLNSHQYPINLSTNLNVNDNNPKVPHQNIYHDITRMDSDLHRYDHPSFQAAIDDPYVSRHD